MRQLHLPLHTLSLFCIPRSHNIFPYATFLTAIYIFIYLFIFILVTGPEGTQVVQILDQCDNSTFRCGGDEVNFGIDNTTFGIIANRTEVDIIYDLSFR
jgi:hypothetical protein